MSVTAQRQDISDPEIVRRFAQQVGERERLDYLYLLTVADIAGTSPKLWNAWKDKLLADLHTATRFVLRQGLEHRVHAEERIAETRAAALALLQKNGFSSAMAARVWNEFPDESFLRYRPEQIAWQTLGIATVEDRTRPLVLARPHGQSTAFEVFVYSPDRDGLFAAAAAALDRLDLSIAEARIVTSRQGMSLDTFQALDLGTGTLLPAQRAAQIAQTLTRALAQIPYRISPARRIAPRALRHFRVPPRIEFAPESDGTRMTLICSDRPGLLAQVAAVLRAQRLRVREARIATFGERVEDFFQLTDETDRPIENPARLETLRHALIDCVSAAYGEARKAKESTREIS